jgi:hypothetical protein
LSWRDIYPNLPKFLWEIPRVLFCFLIWLPVSSFLCNYYSYLIVQMRERKGTVFSLLVNLLLHSSVINLLFPFTRPYLSMFWFCVMGCTFCLFFLLHSFFSGILWLWNLVINKNTVIPKQALLRLLLLDASRIQTWSYWLPLPYIYIFFFSLSQGCFYLLRFLLLGNCSSDFNKYYDIVRKISRCTHVH